MKTIVLREISLLNFQGSAAATYRFDGNSLVTGDNGTGKTTIFDAFLWCLFGKNSKNKTENDFDIKTLDSSGNVIPKLPHEVTVTLLVDGDELVLRRCYKEVWKKRRGELEDSFDGHELEYYINDVPKRKKDYQEMIAGICSETTFRFITDPTYFFLLNKKEQRNILISIAENITDADIAKRSDKYMAMFNKIAGRKTLEDYREEMSARLSMANAKLKELPIRIEERQRSAAPMADTNFTAVASEKNQLEYELRKLEKVLADESSRFNAINDAHKQKQQTLAMLTKQKDDLHYKLQRELTAEYYKQVGERDSIKSKLESTKSRISLIDGEIRLLSADIDKYDQNIDECSKEIASLNGTVFQWKKEDATCPTCGHVFSADRQQEIYVELKEKHNQRIASALKKQNEIMAFANQRKVELENELKKKQDERTAVSEEHASLSRQLDRYIRLPTTAPDVTRQIASNAEVVALAARIAEIQRECDSFVCSEPANTEILEQMQTLKAQISTLNDKLAEEKVLDNELNRIAELKEEFKKVADEASALEYELTLIQSFIDEKMQAVQESVNALFPPILQFRMFKQLVNGSYVDDCEALVCGVPYSRSLNSAAKINAGIEVCNMFVKRYDTCAPIFIDNAESSNHIIGSIGQQIQLSVSSNNTIQITKL